MPERTFASNVDAPVGFPNWSAIWAGMFTFIAIWSVFGLLGAAIFASVANPNAANPITSMGVGIGIWAVILTIVAMFFAGRTTGRLGGRTNAIMSGTVTYGLSVTAALVIAILGGLGLGALATTSGLTHSGYFAGALAGLGWTGFVALFLGWIAAIGGAWSVGQRRSAEALAEQARRAAA